LTSPQENHPRALESALALADGSVPTGGRFLAPSVDGWFASPRQGLTAAIQAVSGADDAAGALARLAPSTLTVVAIVACERACWAEINRRADDDEETCILGLTYGDDGDVSRLIFLRAPVVPVSHVGEDGIICDGRSVIERYFADLMHARFRAAAAHFTIDTIYSHPPYRGGTERVLFRGRDALRRGFVTERGESPARQVITGFWQRRDRVFVEGVIDGLPRGGAFVSTGQLTSRGEIARYVAFYSARRMRTRRSSLTDAGPATLGHAVGTDLI
jgi:hypothetical protein